MEKFPLNWMRSKKGKSREDDFYLDIEEKKDFLDHYTVTYRCTDLQIKFFNSIMDGKVKFVKHALNIGKIRNDYDTMRAAVNLACRFGQAQALELFLDKIHDHFFKAENLNFVMAIVAGTSEAGRLESSGIIEVIIRFARKSYDKRKLKWISGKIELDWTAFGKFQTTPFMEICGRKGSRMSYVIKKILEADEYLVDVNQVIGETAAQVGDSALTQAILSGEKQVVKILLDQMRWERSNALEQSNMNHIQCVLASYIHYLSDPDCESTDVLLFSKRDDRMDIIQMMIEKCFRVTPENWIGHNNAAFMQKYTETLYVHEHFEAMLYRVIEEEKRIAHANGKLTWYDFYGLQIAEGPWTKHGQGPNGTMDRNFYSDQLDRYLKSFHGAPDKILGIPGSFVYIEQLLTGLDTKREKCWSCGDQDCQLMVCKQCRKARYCDPLCQDEDWEKHQLKCKDMKMKREEERKEETREEREARKAKRRNSKDNWSETTLALFQVAMVFQGICKEEQKC